MLNYSVAELRLNLHPNWSKRPLQSGWKHRPKRPDATGKSLKDNILLTIKSKRNEKSICSIMHGRTARSHNVMQDI